MHFSSLLAAAMAASAISAFEIPPNLQTFYQGVSKGGCQSFISDRGDLNDGHGTSGFGFCTDTVGVVYISGRSGLADMDIDCDGSANCNGESQDFQPATAFDYQLMSDNYGIASLDAGKIPFVVLGTCDADVASTIPPLSVVAVVCGGQVHYGVFGDTNGCDGDNFTGEASISLARLCFPDEGLNGNRGHSEHDVLYLAFTDQKAIPGPNGADWTTSDPVAFESSIKQLGESLIAGAFGGSPITKEPEVPVPPPAHNSQVPCGDDKKEEVDPEEGGACFWPGHCAGDTCSSSDDCSDDLECAADGKCAASE